MTYEIRNLTTGYQTAKAVHVVGKHITAQLQAGELTCLLGPNGAGKSTLLRTLAAFQPPLEGQLLLDGKPLEEYSAQQLATRIGIVLTERPDIKGMRVREMVAMGRSPYTGFWGRLSEDDEKEKDPDGTVNDNENEELTPTPAPQTDPSKDLSPTPTKAPSQIGVIGGEDGVVSDGDENILSDSVDGIPMNEIRTRIDGLSGDRTRSAALLTAVNQAYKFIREYLNWVG